MTPRLTPVESDYGYPLHKLEQFPGGSWIILRRNIKVCLRPGLPQYRLDVMLLACRRNDRRARAAQCGLGWVVQAVPDRRLN